MVDVSDLLPMHLDVRGRPVLVVGAGPVGQRRAETLLRAGAVVSVVAPDAAGQLPPGVELTPRRFVETDVDGAWLVFACTDDAEVNGAVAAAAEARRVFCVRADDGAAGTARTPVVTEFGPVTVSATSGDPRRSRELIRAVAEALAEGRLLPPPVRRDAVGSVALVGGGPGDPGLITVRGRQLVAEAEVVVVDRLAPRQLLDTLAPDVEIIDAGKSAHRHNLTQDEINAVIVDRARAGRRVVRLKGGDPFVFGRGGEEYLACVAAGVPVTIVPGVTSALAAPARALIPLTHRGVAGEFTVVSGHHDPGSGEGPDWARLAAGGTLVLLMGVGELDAIARVLIRHGRRAGTPAAVIQQAGTPQERVVRAPLDWLAAAVAEAGIGAPAVIVIGEVVDVLQSDPPGAD